MRPEKKLLSRVANAAKVIVILLVVILSPAIWLRYFTSPEGVIHQFQTGQVPEECLDDVLLLAGSRMAPSLNRLVRDRSTERRGYMIIALGAIGDHESKSVLAWIASDGTEDVNLRECAIIALNQLDPVLAQQTIESQNLAYVDGLKQSAEMIVFGASMVDRELHRSWLEILSSVYS